MASLPPLTPTSSVTTTTTTTSSPLPPSTSTRKPRTMALQFGLGLLLLFFLRLLFSYFSVLLPFFLGYLSALLTIPLVLYFVYHTYLKTDFDGVIGPVNPLVPPKKSLEELVAEDQHKETSTWGPLTVQYQGNRSERFLCFCALKGETFFFQNQSLKGKGLAGEVREVHLGGAYIRQVTKDPYPGEVGYERALELIHPANMSLFKKDYIYIVAADDKTFQRWYYAFLTVCKPWESLYSDKEIADTEPTMAIFADLLSEHRLNRRFDRPESASFLNLVLARLWIHLHKWKEIEGKILNILQTKIRVLLNDYSHYFTDVVVDTIKLGSGPPQIGDVVTKESFQDDPVNSDLVVEFPLSEKGDTMLSFRARVAVGPVKSEIKVSIFIKEFHGTIKLVFAPFPFGRVALSMVGDPELDLDVKVVFGNKNSKEGSLSGLPSTLKKFIAKKVAEILREGFVYPNREYIKLPGVDELEIPSPELKLVVRNEAVDGVDEEDTTSSISAESKFQNLKHEHRRDSVDGHRDKEKEEKEKEKEKEAKRKREEKEEKEEREREKEIRKKENRKEKFARNAVVDPLVAAKYFVETDFVVSPRSGPDMEKKKGIFASAKAKVLTFMDGDREKELEVKDDVKEGLFDRFRRKSRAGAPSKALAKSATLSPRRHTAEAAPFHTAVSANLSPRHHGSDLGSEEGDDASSTSIKAVTPKKKKSTKRHRQTVSYDNNQGHSKRVRSPSPSPRGYEEIPIGYFHKESTNAFVHTRPANALAHSLPSNPSASAYHHISDGDSHSYVNASDSGSDELENRLHRVASSGNFDVVSSESESESDVIVRTEKEEKARRKEREKAKEKEREREKRKDKEKVRKKKGRGSTKELKESGKSKKRKEKSERSEKSDKSDKSAKSERSRSERSKSRSYFGEGSTKKDGEGGMVIRMQT